MGQPPTTWTNIGPRKPIVYLKCRSMDLKEAMQEETLSRKLVMEPRHSPKPKIHLRISLAKKYKSPQIFSTVRPVPIPIRRG